MCPPGQLEPRAGYLSRRAVREAREYGPVLPARRPSQSRVNRAPTPITAPSGRGGAGPLPGLQPWGRLGSEAPTSPLLCLHRHPPQCVVEVSTPAAKDEGALSSGSRLRRAVPKQLSPPPRLPSRLTSSPCTWKPLAGSRAATRLGDDGGLGPACVYSALEVPRDTPPTTKRPHCRTASLRRPTVGAHGDAPCPPHAPSEEGGQGAAPRP